MDKSTFRAVAKRAVSEAAEAVRWNKPVSVVLALASAGSSFFVTWLATGSYAWGAVGGLGAAALLFFVLFVGKLVTVPLAMLREAAATHAAEIAKRDEQILALTNPKRRPHHDDGIFQYGRLVGSVLGHVVKDKELTFSRIEDSAAFDFQTVARFQDMLFVVLKIDQMIGMEFNLGGGSARDVKQGVHCRIVGDRSAVL